MVSGRKALRFSGRLIAMRMTPSSLFLNVMSEYSLTVFQVMLFIHIPVQ
jgi:hypothetical protein